MEFFKSIFTEAQDLLDDFVSNRENLLSLERAGNEMVSSLRSGNKIVTCGNGGSMCDAMHFAEELTGRFREDRPPIAALSISDPSYLSCTANDYGYDQIFSRYIEGLGKAGDILVAISTSGESPNVVNAIRSARVKQMIVIGLTGGDGGDIAGLCDVEIRVPWSKYSDRIQEIHIKIIHALVQYIESKLT